uniref:Uncharacterized protein n=1 Tax=Caenorhabditis japonica TaxID=281687 RepID=A0A8R1I4L9_CAEJA
MIRYSLVAVVAKKVRPPPRGHVDSFVDVFRVQGSVPSQLRCLLLLPLLHCQDGQEAVRPTAAEVAAPPPGDGLPQLLSVLAMDTSEGSGQPSGEARASQMGQGAN